MILTPEEIKEYIKNPRAKEYLSDAREFEMRHRLHVLGEGYDTWLEDQSKDLEAPKTLARKKKLCRPKTVSLISQIQKQFSKIFRAKGNVFNYTFKGDKKDQQVEFSIYLQNFSNGMSMDQVMQDIWFKAMFERFNGFIGIELKSYDELKDKAKEEPFVKLYTVNQTHDVYIRGNRVEYIILNWLVKIGDEMKDAYRVIDDEKDVIYYMDAQSEPVAVMKITEENPEGIIDSIPNKFKQVPFIHVSSYRESSTDDHKKISVISTILGDADNFLSVSDDHTISVKMHQKPIFYTAPAMCITCNGTGETTRLKEDGTNESTACGICKGQKMVSPLMTDVSQGYILPHVESNDGTIQAATAPCGYVSPDIESLREQRVEMESEKKAMERGALGVEGLLTIEDTPRQETATKAELNLQPLMDTLEPFSANASTVRQFLTDMTGRVVYADSFEKSYIYYGRKYFLKSESQVMDDLKKSREAGATKAFIRELMEELYWIQFEGNPKARERAIMMLDLEPLPDIKDNAELAIIAPWTDPITLRIKVNFNDFIERFEQENTQITFYEMGKDYNERIKLITDKLTQYANEIKPAPIAGTQAGSTQNGAN